MTPREELLTTARLGDLGADLLYRSVYAVAVGHAFPPPEGCAIWNRDTAIEAAHDFLEDGQTPRRLMDIALRSVDDASFARLLGTAVLNWLRDRARRTDLGKLILRVKEILRSSGSFVHVGGPDDRWARPGDSAGPGTPEPTVLASAIANLPVTIPRWTSTLRDAPLADRPSLEALIEALLTAAGGSLPVVEIAHALTTRLDHRRVPLTVSIDVLEGAEPADVGADPADRTAAEVHATAIFDALSDRERLLVPHLEQTVREIASRIGTGKSQAALIMQRLVDHLRRELEDDSADEAEDTMRVVCELCGAWLRRRTGTEGCNVPVGHRHEEEGEG